MHNASVLKQSDYRLPPTADADSLDGEYGDEESPSSASWVGRKVDAIFSPVLSFLQGASNNSSSNIDGCGEGTRSSSRLQQQSDELPASSTDDKGVVAGSTSSQAREHGESDLRTDENRPYSLNTLNSPDNNKSGVDHSNDIPAMTTTESSGSHAVDGDGDVSMVDNYQTQMPEAESESALDEDGDEDEFNPYFFIKCLPPYQHAIPPGWSSRPKALPPLDYATLPPPPPICLVLDLDETLVHCTVEPIADADMTFPVEFNGTEYQVHVRCRPFLQQFLEAVSRKFEVVIFTASQQVYADKLLDKLDPKGKFIHHRMFRDSCLSVEGNFLKDLTILGRDLSKAVLVDNSPHVFGYQVDNGIPIESWFDDPHDKELLKLEMFLRTLHGVDDVRDVLRKTFQTQRLVRNA